MSQTISTSMIVPSGKAARALLISTGLQPGERDRPATTAASAASPAPLKAAEAAQPPRSGRYTAL